MNDLLKRDSEWLTTRTFLLLLAAALLAVFPEITLGLHTFFYRDFGGFSYPGRVFVRDSLGHGQLPLWNPYCHCGVPWLAQMGQWYPPMWICYVLPLPWAESFLVLAHLWFGGFGIFWLLRRWNIGSFAAAFAAFAFVFNGVSFSCLEWGHYIASIAWLPWIVGWVSASWRPGGYRLVFAAIASAMQVLTGTPEITLLTWLFVGALWLGEVLSRDVGFVSSVWRTSLIILLAVGITAVQILPFFDLLVHSQRNPGNAEAAVWSMPAWGLANLLVPLFHCYQSPQGTWFQHGQDFLPSYYLGAGTLALAFIGVLAKRNRAAIIIAAMILFYWLMAQGTNGFLYQPVERIFHVISIARFPVKFTILTAFLVPLLAARGIEILQAPQNKTAQRMLLIIGISFIVLMAALLCFAYKSPFPFDNFHATALNTLLRVILMAVLLAGTVWSFNIKERMARIAVQVIVLAILPLDALTHSPNIAPVLPSDVLAPGIWQATGRPPLPQGQGRIMVSPNAEQALLYSRVPDMKADFIGKRVAEWYNLNLLDGLPKVNGAVPLRPASFDVLERYLYYTAGGHCGRGLVDFLSVAWLTAPDNPTEWLVRTNYLPLITAGQKPVFANDDQTLQGIVANDFEPRTVVYLPESSRPMVTITNQTTCLVTNATFRLNDVEADVNASGPALVVLSQSYYHLWHAFVDRKPVPLLRANLAFQAVEVPAGQHHVQWVFSDPNLKIGAVISLLSLAICIVIFFRRQQDDLPERFDF
jgi:hypothetical protein